MFKNCRYLLLLMVLFVLAGCETLNGASNGFGKDVQNASDSSKNGWDAIQKADGWIRENLW